MRKYYWGLATSLTTLLPLAAGAVLACALWAGDNPALAVFAGVLGALAAGAAFTYRAAAGSERIMRRAEEEIRAEEEQAAQVAQQAKEAALDALDRQLVHCDNDPRPEESLRNMRHLLRWLKADQSLTAAIDRYNAGEILKQAEALFGQSVLAMKRTIELQAQIDMAGDSEIVSAPLKAEKEAIIVRIQADVEALSKVLAELRGIGSQTVDAAADRPYSEQGQNLLLQLEAAKRAKQEMKSLGLGRLDRQQDSG
jgi:hypothetical protein